MTANEYLQNTCNQLDSPKLSESPEIYEFFQDWADLILGSDFQVPIFVLDSYTTEVYPRYVHFSDTNIVIWDNHFWDLYGHFLFMLFTYQNVNVLPDSLYEEYFTSLVLLFLANRFERYPSLARYISETYSVLNLKIPPYDQRDDINDILNKVGHLQELNAAKCFGFCHEMAHVAFSSESAISLEIRKEVISFCEVIIQLYELEEEVSASSELDFKSKELKDLYDIATTLLEDHGGKMIEEISCDVIAMLTLINYFSSHGLSDNEIGDMLSSLHYFFLFTWWLSSTEQFWNTMRMVFSDPANDCAFVDKNSPYYRFGDKLTKEMSVRVNFSFNLLMNTTSVSSRNFRIQNNLISSDFISLLQKSTRYTSMENILHRYTSSHKDFLSSCNHLKKKNRIIGWVNKQKV